MRLRKYIDKLTPLGQKAYSETRQCQEVIIEILENMDSCNSRGTNGGILSLDISKAFDSVSHSYLESVLEFFNFGPNYIRWIKLIATNRIACIILDDCNLSRNFRLDRGNAQGDTISPFLFLLAFQILLFKIELNAQIAGVTEEESQGPLTPLEARWASKQARERKVFVFADDGNIILKLTRENLELVKQILTDFGAISGLGCNVEKTNLLPIGAVDNINNDIRNVGFTIVSNITVLGVEIGENYNTNYTKLLEKVQKQVNFWTRFSLSLPGRINVAKTMLYSQINYMGCVLNFTSPQLESVSKIITKFVGGKLNIASNRFFKSPSEGGLGLFDLPKFLTAQKCSWVKRALTGNNNWKIKLQNAGNGTIFNQDPLKIQAGEYGILRGISSSFKKFASEYLKINNNYASAYIFNNDVFTLSRARMCPLTNEYFGNLWPAYEMEISCLKFNHFVGADGYKSFDEVRDTTGIPITDQKIVGLRGLCDIANERYKNLGENNATMNLTMYVTNIRKGSKKFRKILSGRKDEVITQNIKKFAENIDIIIPLEKSKILNAGWTPAFFSNQLRTFIFKLHNNCLGYNYMVSRFVRNIEPYCTFCMINRLQDLEPETPLHIFYNCPVVEPVLADFFSQFRPTRMNLRRVDLFGLIDGADYSNTDKFGFWILCTLAKFYIWECKLRKCSPNRADMEVFVNLELDGMGSVSKKAKNLFIPAINAQKIQNIQG